MKELFGVMFEKLNNFYYFFGIISWIVDWESWDVLIISINSCGLIVRYLFK